MKISQALVELLKKEGCDTVFGVVGAYADKLFEEFALQNFNVVIASHEAGACFMADGYARSTGKLGIVLVLSTPGLGNAITGLLTAKTASSRVLLIAGESPLRFEGLGAFQESGVHSYDLLEAIRTMTSGAMRVSSPEQLGIDFRSIIRGMYSPVVGGPGFIAIPQDVQSMEVSDELITHYRPVEQSDARAQGVDQKAVDSAVAAILQQKKVALLVGENAHGCADEVMRLAEKAGLPVITTQAVKGLFPERHELALGLFGWFGHQHANDVILHEKLDLLICVGSSLGMLDSLGWAPELCGQTAIICNPTPSAAFDKFPDAVYAQGMPKAFLDQLYEGIKDQVDPEVLGARKKWVETVKNKSAAMYAPDDRFSEQLPIHTARAIRELQIAVADRPASIFIDTGAHALFAGHYWQQDRPNSFFSCLLNTGAMGWAYGASIGAKAGNPGSLAICISGDGCTLMHGTEMKTAAKYNIPVLFVIFNNQALGNPKYRYSQHSNDKVGRLADIGPTDLRAFAESLGVPAMSVSDPTELHQTFMTALQQLQVGPVAVEVKVGHYPTPTVEFDRRYKLAG